MGNFSAEGPPVGTDGARADPDVDEQGEQRCKYEEQGPRVADSREEEEDAGEGRRAERLMTV